MSSSSPSWWGTCLLALIAGIMDMIDNEVVLEVPSVPVKGRRLKHGLLEVGSLLQQHGIWHQTPDPRSMPQCAANLSAPTFGAGCLIAQAEACAAHS